MKNDFNYKWSKLFASKRYNTKDGVIELTPQEQQELLDDSERVVKNCSIPVVVGQSEQLVCYKKCGDTQPYNNICLNCGSSINYDAN